jgi:hypothetical protein
MTIRAQLVTVDDGDVDLRSFGEIRRLVQNDSSVLCA